MKFLLGRGAWAAPAGVVFALPFLLAGRPVQAQDNLTVFKGATVEAADITAAGWGSGTVTLDKQFHLAEGVESYKIVTHGIYQGASLTFAKPFDLGPFVANKSSYFQLNVYLPELFSATGEPSNFSPGGPGRGRPNNPYGNFNGGFGGGPPGGLPPGGPSPAGAGYFGGLQPPPPPPGGGRPGGGGGPGFIPGSGGGKSANFQRPRVLENLRVVLLTGSGATIEFLMPVVYTHGADAWRQFNIPVSAIPGLKAADAQIKEMRIFGDAPTTFWLGGIRTVTDNTPLAIGPIEDQSALPKNALYRYAAKVTSGASACKVTWDFDETDGIQEDKVGASVTYAYRKPTDTRPDYIITVTVTDVYGIKPPATRKFKVHVTG